MDRDSHNSLAASAGSWDARLRSPDCTDADRAQFDQWRNADPRHRTEFERLQMLLATLRHDRGRADIRGLQAQALRVAGLRSRRVWWSAAAASVAIAVVGSMLWSRWWETETFATGNAQKSTFVLQDGSTVELNAQSRINVAFTDTRRDIELLEGQALFHVARSPSRPFVVSAGDRQIVALGTQFDVKLDAHSVQITLIEGKVRVDHSNTEEAVLTPGSQLVAPLASASQVRSIDVAKVTGWREGRIFLDGMTLRQAAAEMNKHSPMQIRIDESIAQLQVFGMFRAGEQQAFVDALEEYFPIVVRSRDRQGIVLARKE